jgi:hypothetical protein
MSNSILVSDMNLRDYFAAKIVAARITKPGISYNIDLAKTSYAIADLMMEARNLKQSQVEQKT